jgi:hypothetical protein
MIFNEITNPTSGIVKGIYLEDQDLVITGHSNGKVVLYSSVIK